MEKDLYLRLFAFCLFFNYVLPECNRIWDQRTIFSSLRPNDPNQIIKTTILSCRPKEEVRIFNRENGKADKQSKFKWKNTKTLL